MQERRRCHLLGTNTLEDHLHIGVPLPLKTNLTSILPPYMLRVWGSVLKFAFPLLMSSKNGLPHSTIACNVSLPITKGLQGCALGKIYGGPSGAQAFKLGCRGRKDRALWSPKNFSWGARASKLVAQINRLVSCYLIIKN